MHSIKNLIRQLIVYLMTIISRKSFNHKNAQKLNGLNLIGPDEDRGLGFVLESVRQSLKHKLPTHRMYLPAVGKQKSKYIHERNLFVGNPGMLLTALIQLPILPLYHHKNIGLFFWELEKIPLEWVRLRHWLDEIWVQSDFVLNTFKKMSVPIHKIPFALNLKINKKLSRASFNLPKNPFIFLFTFDYFFLL